MKHSLGMGFVVAGAMLLISSAAMAFECSGSWRVLPNYRPGSGGVCAALGLNTHRAVCQPGQRYATYCDDTSGGRYRTCQSNIPCSSMQRYPGHRGYDDDSRYYRYDYDGQRDYRYDRRDDYRDYHDDYRQRKPDRQPDRQPDCTHWDYNANRPCPPGTINRDCRNGCDGR